MKLPSKEKVYEVIFGFETRAGKLYDVFLLAIIMLSILVAQVESLPRISPTAKNVLTIIEYILTFIFTVEYIVRIWCSPRKRSYIFSFFGIVDFLATIPLYIIWFFPGARYISQLRALRLLRVFRIFKLFQFINEGYLLLVSIKKSFNRILVFFLFIVVLVSCLGTLMYMVEGRIPGSQFTDLTTSIYWAIVTLTTVGYGDVTPVTLLGKILSSIIMLLGYTIIAIPTGIVAATIIDETQEPVKNGRCPRCGKNVNEKRDTYCWHCGEKL
ncbi:MAG: ion transporter [Bacteroidaceae bacterium]|nr:ion transporter [Bacteroidaceae bacterium]